MPIAEAKEAAASGGSSAGASSDSRFALPDEAWRIIAPNFDRADRQYGRLAIPSRDLLEGFLTLVGSKADWSELPKRFGDPVMFKAAWQRLVAAGTWDEAATILRRHFPDRINRAHDAYLRTEEFPSGIATKKPLPFFEKADAERHLKGLIGLRDAHPTNAGIRLHAAILFDVLSGDEIETVAERWLVKIEQVDGLVAMLQRHGVQFLEPTMPLPPEKRRSRHTDKLTREQTEHVVQIARKMRDAMEADARFPIRTLVAQIELLYETTYGTGALTILLRRQGVLPKKPTTAERKAMRQAAASLRTSCKAQA